MTGAIAIIPIRSLSEGKSRLAGYVSNDDRAELIRTMFEHVIATVKAAGVIDRIVVISPDPAVIDLMSRDSDVRVMAVKQPEGRPGLNAAIELGRELATDLRAGAMLVLFGDLPLIKPDDVRSLVRRDAPLIIATDRHGVGTNALMLRLGSASAAEFRFAYGAISRQRHLNEADRLGLDAITAVSAGTAVDLDTIDDVERLGAYGRSFPAWMARFSAAIEEKSA
jgi:2-phospho-L-lactate guanylyltransferase